MYDISFDTFILLHIRGRTEVAAQDFFCTLTLSHSFSLPLCSEVRYSFNFFQFKWFNWSDALHKRKWSEREEANRTLRQQLAVNMCSVLCEGTRAIAVEYTNRLSFVLSLVFASLSLRFTISVSCASFTYFDHPGTWRIFFFRLRLALKRSYVRNSVSWSWIYVFSSYVCEMHIYCAAGKWNTSMGSTKKWILCISSVTTRLMVTHKNFSYVYFVHLRMLSLFWVALQPFSQYTLHWFGPRPCQFSLSLRIAHKFDGLHAIWWYVRMVIAQFFYLEYHHVTVYWFNQNLSVIPMVYADNKNINYYDSHLIAMKITVASAFAILKY